MIKGSDKLIYGNILSLTIYTLFVLFAAIGTGSVVLFLISIINFALIIYQYNKQKISKKHNLMQEEKATEVDTIKAKAKHNIETKYKNSNISEEEKKDLIWEEFLRLMRERK